MNHRQHALAGAASVTLCAAILNPHDALVSLLAGAGAGVVFRQRQRLVASALRGAVIGGAVGALVTPLAIAWWRLASHGTAGDGAALRNTTLAAVWAAGLVLPGVFGGLLPDIDAPGAYLARRLPFLRWGLLGLLSNPVAWWALGGRSDTPTPLPRRLTLGFRLWRWLWSALRGPAGAPAAARWGRGYTQARQWLDHREITHSLAFVGGTATLALIGGGIGALALTASRTSAWAALSHAAASAVGVPGATPLEASLIAIGGNVGALITGMLSHLLLDAMTISGVPLLLPWTDRRFWALPERLRMRTKT